MGKTDKTQKNKKAKKTKKTKKTKEPKIFVIGGTTTTQPEPKAPRKSSTKKKKNDNPRKAADMTEDEWLEKQSENPYVKLKKKILQKIDPRKHMVWIKYIKKDNSQRCTGGMLVKNAYPTYIKLRNPYSRVEFSVQLPNVTPYTRKKNIEIIKTKV